jgi:hypothetical protein
LEDRYAVLGYSSREKINRLVARSGGKLRVADSQSAYLPLPSAADRAATAFGEVKSLLRPDAQAA